MSNAEETALVETEVRPAAMQVKAPADMLNMVSQLAMNPEADINKIERLMDMYERLQNKESESNFNNVMAEAQAQMKTVKYNKYNQQTQSSYTDLSAIIKKIKPIYTELGMSLSFTTEPQQDETLVRVVCMVSVAGHTRRYEYDSPITDKGIKGTTMMTKAHARGSAISYGRRYLTAMIFNLDTSDDDDAASYLSNIEYITRDQEATLDGLIEEVGANKAQFLKVLKIDELGQLPANKYDGAVKRLEQKRK